MIVSDRFLWSLSTDDRERTKNSITTVILKFSDPWNATFNGLLVIKLLFVKETTNIEYKYVCVLIILFRALVTHLCVIQSNPYDPFHTLLQQTFTQIPAIIIPLRMPEWRPLLFHCWCARYEIISGYLEGRCSPIEVPISEKVFIFISVGYVVSCLQIFH